MGTTILRLDSASAIDGNLHQMDSADEEWIAYQAGLRIADYLSGDFVGADLSLAPYSVTDVSGGANTVGTYTDTIETAADGAKPSSITTTNTSVFQKTGKVSLSSNRRYPVEFVSGTPNQLTEMDSSEVDTIAGRLKEYLFDSDNHWAGVIKLGSSAPSAEYTQYETAFADTIGNPATTTQYNFYVKNYVTSGDSASIPTESRPVSLKRSSGLTGTFQGIQEMTDSDIGETFGRAIMTNVMSTSNGIGTYQLRSATQGAPTDTGTWKAMGTATDTRRTVTASANFTRTSTRERDENFTRERDQNFTRNSTANFTRTSTRTSTSDFEGNYSPGVFAGNYTAIEYTGNFVGNYETGVNYTRNSTATFTRQRATNYTRTSTRTRSTDYTRTSTRTSTRNSTRTSTNVYNYTGDFTGNFGGNFTGNFVGDFAGNYTGDFTGNFDGNYTGDFEGNYAATRVTDSTRTSVSATYEGNYQIFYAGAYTGDFAGNYTGDFTGDFEGNYTGDFEGNYTGDFTGNYEGNYAGAVLETGTSQTIETYTLYLRCA